MSGYRDEVVTCVHGVPCQVDLDRTVDQHHIHAPYHGHMIYLRDWGEWRSHMASYYRRNIK